MDKKILKSVSLNNPEIYRELINFFKAEGSAEKWLKTPHWMLNDKTPIDALENSPQSVMDLINTLKRGDFS